MHKFEIATVLLLQAINLVSAKSARVRIVPDATNQLGKGISGTVTFTQQSPNQQMVIQVFIIGLTPGSVHGMHIHKDRIQNQNCTLASTHWNPMNAPHGAPQNTVDKRHYGDLGNFQANAQGVVSRVFTDRILSFAGAFPITNNLALVFHEKQDDLGLGQGDKAAESSKTGNCGSRLACGNFRLIDAYGACKSCSYSMYSANKLENGTLVPGSGSTISSTATVSPGAVTSTSTATSPPSTGTAINLAYSTYATAVTPATITSVVTVVTDLPPQPSQPLQQPPRVPQVSQPAAGFPYTAATSASSVGSSGSGSGQVLVSSGNLAESTFVSTFVYFIGALLFI